MSSASELDYTSLTPAARSDLIDQMFRVIAGVEAELARALVAADEAKDFVADGAADLGSWLAYRAGLTHAHGREWARVARAVTELPQLHEAWSGGVLSWDQIRPATRFATAETDADLAEELPGYSARQIEALARRHRPRSDDDDKTAHARRSLRFYPDRKKGGYRYRGFLPTDQAAAVNEMLTKLADEIGPDAVTGLWEPFDTRCADALHDLCNGESTETTVTVHVDAEVLAGIAEGSGFIGHDDLDVTRRTVLRYLCDSRIDHVVETADGQAIGIGRASRNPPRWLRRQVKHRDGCCRFPGCDRRIRHIHHVQWWTRDGPTDGPNLAGVCWLHHHLVHEGGWTVTGDANHELTFTSPNGRVLTSRRRPTRPHTREATQALLGTADAEGDESDS